jgi:hypothetical protein
MFILNKLPFNSFLHSSIHSFFFLSLSFLISFFYLYLFPSSFFVCHVLFLFTCCFLVANIWYIQYTDQQIHWIKYNKIYIIKHNSWQVTPDVFRHRTAIFRNSTTTKDHDALWEYGGQRVLTNLHMYYMLALSKESSLNCYAML